MCGKTRGSCLCYFPFFPQKAAAAGAASPQPRLKVPALRAARRGFEAVRPRAALGAPFRGAVAGLREESRGAPAPSGEGGAEFPAGRPPPRPPPAA